MQVEDVHHWDLIVRDTSHLQVPMALLVHLSGMKDPTVPTAARVWCGDSHPHPKLPRAISHVRKDCAETFIREARRRLCSVVTFQMCKVLRYHMTSVI